ncbi:hypothetical protein ACX3YD_30615 [Pseudomonas fluorescens group sp. PF-1]
MQIIAKGIIFMDFPANCQKGHPSLRNFIDAVSAALSLAGLLQGYNQRKF